MQGHKTETGQTMSERDVSGARVRAVHARVCGGSENDATTVPTARTRQLDGIIGRDGAEAAAYM
jgi:hypothetical protein